jgi:hypothetical protein
MRKGFVTLLIVFVLRPSVQATDKIRIGVPELNAQFLPLALAEKRGTLKRMVFKVRSFA